MKTTKSKTELLARYLSINITFYYFYYYYLSTNSLSISIYLYYLKSVCSQLTEWEKMIEKKKLKKNWKKNLIKKMISRIKKKFFRFALVITIPWNLEKCSRAEVFRCKLRVKSNFTNVNLYILLFSFISNYEDGQKRITQLLKPTRMSIPSKQIHVRSRNRSAREIFSRLTIKTPERRHWRRSGVSVVKV